MLEIPGLDPNSPEEDLYPPDEEDQGKVVSWAQSAMTDSVRQRQEQEDRWNRYYKMYRSWGGQRRANDWQSRVWIPVAFYVVETIVPRLVAQLPKLTVMPVGPDDTEGAKQMEYLLDYVTDQSDLYLELVKTFKSSLIYGTGILKTLYDEQYAYSISRQPVMQPTYMEMPLGEMDVDGNPLTQQVQVGEEPTGEVETVREKVVKYAGPAAEHVDIFDFFCSPEATTMEDASYVIHRVYRTREHIEQAAKNGHYHLPDKDKWDSFVRVAYDRWAQRRMSEVGLGSQSFTPTAKGTGQIELLEIWTDELVLTIAGGGAADGIGGGNGYLLRAERNPYAHGEKPFVRIMDHMVPDEFWGIGELEPLEGVQDTINALWNSRIDNVKLVLNKMFAVSIDYLEDESDLVIRPGGVIRLREGVPIDQALKGIDLGEVTSSSYTEAAEMERLSEKVSGVSAYQTGTDSPALNRTATGVALISEQGNTRFAHKVRISELTGLRKLARQFGAILQQYMPEQMVVRVLGPMGQFLWQTIDAQSIAGAFDYAIEAESASQTESIRREQAMGLFNTLVQLPEINRQRLIEDVLETFGRKDTQDYIMTPQQMYMAQMMQQMQQAQMQQNALPAGQPQGGPPPQETNAPPTNNTGGPPPGQ